MEESLFNDCFDRAVLGAGAAVDASIGNSISHDFPSNCNVNFHLNDVIHILTWIFQNATAFLKKV